MEDTAKAENSHLHTKNVIVAIIIFVIAVLWWSHACGPWAVLLCSVCSYAIFVLWPACPISQLTYKMQTHRKYRWIREFKRTAGQYCFTHQANLSAHHQTNHCQVCWWIRANENVKGIPKEEKNPQHWSLSHLKRDLLSRTLTTKEKTLLEILKGGWRQLSSRTKQKQRLSFQQNKLAKVEGPAVMFCLNMDKATEFYISSFSSLLQILLWVQAFPEHRPNKSRFTTPVFGPQQTSAAREEQKAIFSPLRAFVIKLQWHSYSYETLMLPNSTRV